jgi:hypothetical protein
MKERGCGTTQKKAAKPGTWTYEEQRKEHAKNQERKNGEDRRNWGILVTEFASKITVGLRSQNIQKV